MNQRRRIGTPFALAAAFLAAPGCAKTESKAPAKAVASKVEKLPGEADLTSVTLTEGAERRIGIQTSPVIDKAVARSRTLGGELIVPPGHLLAVAAPLAGTLHAPKSGTPEAGARVKAGQVVFELTPLLSPESQATMSTTVVEAQGQVDQAEKQLTQAKVLFDRAERLLRDRLGGSGAVADASAAVELANATLSAARTRHDAIESALKGLQGGSMKPLAIQAEAGGVIKNVHAAPGQKVAPGAPLFEIVNTDPLHVRVPVYVGDLPRIDEARPVEIGGLADAPGAKSRTARPVPAPPSADPLGSTVDLFYAVPNPDGALRPGQRVGVTLFLRDASHALTVPRAALLRDYDGGAWVYTAAAPHKYVRKRVGVSAVVGDDVILAFGPPAGTNVVTDGAAELFGVEFGGNK